MYKEYMSGNVNRTVECANCGNLLAPSHKGPCPFCGSEQKLIKVNVHETLNVRVTERLMWTKTREYFENHWPTFVATIALTIASPFIGLFVLGLIGAGIGLIFSVITLVVGFFAVTKVREVERGGDLS